MKMKKTFILILTLIFLLPISFESIGEVKVRIKDITKIQEIEETQLFGYGLVVGLNGTGDKKGVPFTIQSISNMLQRLGISVDSQQLKLKNVAAVMVTCTLSPFNKIGSHIDVTVSSIGDATSLQGGTLLFTPLQTIDGEVYVVAQGQISIGGFNISGGGGLAQKNHPTVGRIPGGGIVKKEISLTFLNKGNLSLVLSYPDFATAEHIAEEINKTFSNSLAKAQDAGIVKVEIPEEYKKERALVDFISQIEGIYVIPDTKAKVVINEKTGTIVTGKNIKISKVAVSHGNLFVTIKTTPIISQPPPFSEGETVTTQKEEIEVKEEKGRMTLVEGATVEELVQALNALGVTPRDIIAIFQAIKEAGALQGELVII